MIMCIQNLVSFCSFILKILNKNWNLTSIKGHNSVAKLGNMRIYNPNVDLVNDNVYTKFGLNKSINPVNPHLISWPSKAQNILNLENIW